MLRNFLLVLLAWVQIEAKDKWVDHSPEVPSFDRKCTAVKTTNGWYTIYCAHCQFNGIPPELPKFTRTLDMSHNKVTKLKAHSFSSSLHFLYKLNMSNNLIHSIEDSTFIGVIGHNLEILDLSNNKLTILPKFFPNSLKVLKLGHNLLEKFFLFDIAYLYSLRVLHLGHNQIRVVQTRLTKRECDVSELFVRNSPVNSGQCVVLRSLEQLNLSGNKLTNISRRVIMALPYLTHLNLKDNRLTCVSNKTFAGSKYCWIKSIDLSYNNITFVGKRAFRRCLWLKFLSLSHNQLQTFPDGLNAMEWLDVSYNQMKSITAHSKPSLYPQEVILLGGNPFHCDCHVKWLKELFDSREYMFHHMSVEYQYFVPICASPENLADEYWDILSTDMFYCYSPPGASVDLTEEDKELLQKSGKTVQVTLKRVSSEDLTITWNCAQKCAEITAYHVTYRQFGHQLLETSLPLSSTVHQYTIRELQPNTAYVVCLSVYVVEGTVADTCLEVVTMPVEKFYFQMVSSILSGSLVYLMIIVISFAILYQLT